MNRGFARAGLGLVIAASALGTVPAGAGGGGFGHGCPQPAEEGRGTRVVMEGFCYRPGILHVPVGEPVRFINMDKAPHTVTGDKGGWGVGELSGSDQAVFRFAEAGSYAYSCTLHPGMTGVIVAGDGTRIGSGADVTLLTDGGTTAAAGSGTSLTASSTAAGRPVAGREQGPGWLFLTLAPLAGVVGYRLGRRRVRAAA